MESLIPIPPLWSDASFKPKADGQWSMGEIPTKIEGGGRWTLEGRPNVCPSPKAPVALSAVRPSPPSDLEDLLMYRV